MRRLICSMFAPLCLLLIQSAAAAQTIVLARGGTDQDRFITADGMTSSGDGSFRLASDPDTEIFVVTVLNTHQPVADTSTTELAATLTRTLFLDGNGTSTLLFRGSRATRVSKALEGPHLISTFRQCRSARRTNATYVFRDCDVEGGGHQRQEGNSMNSIALAVTVADCFIGVPTVFRDPAWRMKASGSNTTAFPRFILPF